MHFRSFNCRDGEIRELWMHERSHVVPCEGHSPTWMLFCRALCPSPAAQEDGEARPRHISAQKVIVASANSEVCSGVSPETVADESVPPTKPMLFQRHVRASRTCPDRIRARIYNAKPFSGRMAVLQYLGMTLLADRRCAHNCAGLTLRSCKDHRNTLNSNVYTI